MRHRNALSALRALAVPLVLLLALVLFTRAVSSLDAGQAGETLQRLTQAVRRSCVACYAAEGRYPQDLDYLIDRYGLQIDQSRYTVIYEPVGVNLMPQITVLECGA